MRNIQEPLWRFFSFSFISGKIWNLPCVTNIPLASVRIPWQIHLDPWLTAISHPSKRLPSFIPSLIPAWRAPDLFLLVPQDVTLHIKSQVLIAVAFRMPKFLLSFWGLQLSLLTKQIHPEVQEKFWVFFPTSGLTPLEIFHWTSLFPAGKQFLLPNNPEYLPRSHDFVGSQWVRGWEQQIQGFSHPSRLQWVTRPKGAP